MLFGLLCVVLSGAGLLLSDWFPGRCALCQRKGVRVGFTNFHEKAGAWSRGVYYCDACKQFYRTYDDGSVSIEIVPETQTPKPRHTHHSHPQPLISTPWPNNALQRTEAGGGASSDHDA